MIEEKAYQRLLTDPSRRSPRGAYRYAYTEEQFDRVLRREQYVPIDDYYHGAEWKPSWEGDEAFLRLVDALPLTDREKRMVVLRDAGWTGEEIAEHFGVTVRRVWMILAEIRGKVEPLLGRILGGESK